MSGAGRLPRRLGIGVAPAQGESFPSWVDRMAVRMRIGPDWVVRELGVELLPGGISVVLPTNYGISMSRCDLEAVQSATGVAADAVDGMLLSVYDGTILDLSSLGHGPAGGQAGAREWALFRGSRCCPDCVAVSAGAWQLWWRLGGAAACPLAQPPLADAGQLRYPSLREPLRAQDHDDAAEIPPGARVEHVLPREDAIDYLAHLKDAQSHGAVANLSFPASYYGRHR